MEYNHSFLHSPDFVTLTQQEAVGLAIASVALESLGVQPGQPVDSLAAATLQQFLPVTINTTLDQLLHLYTSAPALPTAPTAPIAAAPTSARAALAYQLVGDGLLLMQEEPLLAATPENMQVSAEDKVLIQKPGNYRVVGSFQCHSVPIKKESIEVGFLVNGTECLATRFLPFAAQPGRDPLTISCLIPLAVGDTFQVVCLSNTSFPSGNTWPEHITGEVKVERIP